MKLEMENRGKKVHSQFAAHESPARRFYAKYWLKAEDAIPTRDPTTQKRLELLFHTLKKTGRGRKDIGRGMRRRFFYARYSKGRV